jgi:hypothetical protein
MQEVSGSIPLGSTNQNKISAQILLCFAAVAAGELACASAVNRRATKLPYPQDEPQMNVPFRMGLIAFVYPRSTLIEYPRRDPRG